MDFRLLVFRTVAGKLSFTEAAQELKISQPAITNHIKELEKQYGIQLFDRSQGRIKLTYAGEIFLSHCERILGRYDTLKYTMEALTNEAQGTLRIGANHTASAYFLPPVLAAFSETNGNIKFIVHTGHNKQIEQALLDDKIDIGFYERENRRNDLDYDLIRKEELVLVCSANNETAETVSMEQFLALPLVVREKDSEILRSVERSLAAKGYSLSQLNAVMSIDDTEGIKQLVEESRLFSILPTSAVRGTGLRTVRIEDMTFSMKLYTAYHKDEKNDLTVIFSNFVSNCNMK